MCNYYFECFFSLSYSARNAHVSYYTVTVACLALPYNLLHGIIFGVGGKVLNIKCVFWFYLYFCCPKYFSLLEGLFGVLSYTYIRFHVKCWLFFIDFNQTWIFQIFEKKNWNTKFPKPLSVGSEFLYAGGRTYKKDDEVNSRFSLFCECA
jgi:hypothetical protein